MQTGTDAVYPCAYREHGIAQIGISQIDRFIPVHTGNIEISEIIVYSFSVYPCAYREHLN